MTDLDSSIKYFQGHAQQDFEKMKLAVDEWAKNGEAPPFPQYLEMGVFLDIALAVQLLGHGKADYDKAQLEADVSNIKAKLSHCGTLLKRVKNSIDKSKKAKEEHRKMLEQLAEKAGKDVEKQAQVMKRRAEQEQRRIDKAVTKVGHVSSLYDMDILKLGGAKIHVYTVEDFVIKEIDMANPWCLKFAKFPETAKILDAVPWRSGKRCRRTKPGFLAVRPQPAAKKDRSQRSTWTRLCGEAAWRSSASRRRSSRASMRTRQRLSFGPSGRTTQPKERRCTRWPA